MLVEDPNVVRAEPELGVDHPIEVEASDNSTHRDIIDSAHMAALAGSHDLSAKSLRAIAEIEVRTAAAYD
jgi:hypothetical protein